MYMCTYICTRIHCIYTRIHPYTNHNVTLASKTFKHSNRDKTSFEALYVS